MGAENSRCNVKVYIDFMYIAGDSVLDIVDEAMHFRTAKFIETLTTESIWKTILTLWATVYSGLPDTLVFDDDSQF